MRLLDALVEQRIAAVLERGEFDDLTAGGALPGQEDNDRMPAAVSMANWILKHAGFMPPAVEQLRALGALRDEIDAVGPRPASTLDQAKLLALDMALESLRGDPMVLPREYCRRIAGRLSERVAGGAAPGELQ